MGLFSRRGSTASTGRLPRDTVKRMELFGRFTKDPQATEVGDSYATFYEPFIPVFGPDPTGFVTELAAVCLPVGGWAVYGAQAYVRDATPSECDHPEYLRMLDAGIDFLLAQGYDPAMHLDGFETQRLRDRR